MSVLISIHNEIIVVEEHETKALRIVLGHSKGVLNKRYSEYYLELESLARVLETSLRELTTLIGFLPASGELLSFYRNDNSKSIRVVSINKINQLLKMLRGAAVEPEKLAKAKEKIIVEYQQIQKEK